MDSNMSNHVRFKSNAPYESCKVLKEIVHASIKHIHAYVLKPIAEKQII